MNNPSYLNNLNPPQKEAVLHTDGPLLILAGAGSGKTRVIVSRIAHLINQGVAPWNILAVTFTNKAAAEMRQRVDALSPGQGRAAWVSTFHSFCAKFLRIEAPNMHLSPDFVIYDDNDQSQVVTQILKEMMLPEKQFPVNQIVNAISRAKDEMLDAGSYSIHAQSHNDPFRERVARVYESYQRKLRAANAYDFGDLVMRTVETLRDIPTIREKYQRRFRYLMVDEYQDTNHAQYLMVKYLSGQNKNVCVVGDDDQSIYSWRGATIRNILEFERDFPGAKVVKLEQNYRSSKKILAAAGRLIALNEKRKKKDLWTDNQDGEDVSFVEMLTEQEEARFVIDELQKLVNRHTGEGRYDGEGGAGVPITFKDIAVFYRTNAQSRVFEDALRRLTIPYTIVGALRFYERAEIKDAMGYLRVIVNPKDSLAVKRVINLPARGMGKNSLALLEQYAAAQGISLFEALDRAHAITGLSTSARNGIQQFQALITRFHGYAQKLPASAVVRRVLEETGYWDMWAQKVENDPEAGERLDNLQELINAAKDFEEKMTAGAFQELSDNSVSLEGPPTLGGNDELLGNFHDQANQEGVAEEKSALDNSLARYLQEISLLSDLDEWTDKGGTVTLMTVHLAKGLEFPIVFVTGLEEGLFPIGDSAFDQEELEEERRLAYVAMTRAKEKLYLTCASSRRIFGSPRMNVPSRFVEEAGIKTAAQPRWAAQEEHHYSQDTPYSDDFNQDVPAVSPPSNSAGVVASQVGRPLHQLVKVGTRVEHPDFGTGQILEKEGSGEQTKVVIQFFSSGAKKKLLLKYAPIKIL